MKKQQQHELEFFHNLFVSC